LTGAVTIREPRGDEGPLAERLGLSGAALVLVAESGDGRVLAGAIDPAGSVTEPDAPALRLGRGPSDLAEPLVAALIETAAGTGATRLVAAWDTMDVAGQRMLAGLGFRATGTQPYFERGPDVEFVSGYTDPTGSLVDLARPLP
jgi:hypothetical protein